MSGRFRRWIPCFLAVLLILGMGVMKAQAEEMMELDGASSQRVYDMAELLSKEEEEEFETAIENARKSLGFDIVVVTIEDAGGRNAQDYADYNYEAAGFGHGDSHDGILFLVDMDNRELVLSTEGASEDEFADSVRVFLRDVEYYGEKGISSGQYNYDTETHQISTYKSIRWYEALLALGVSGFVAVAACLTVKRQYAMEEDPKHLKNLNMAYRGDCNFAFRNQQDVFVNKFVTTQVIPRNTSGSGGLGGGSSAGRSSTHHSSSGRTHGGGSRKF